MGDSKTRPDQTGRLHPLQRAVWRALEPYRKRRINVAFSGGSDSTALLSVLSSLREPFGLQVRALHVDHNWSEGSSTWKIHCENFCRRLDIPFESFTLKWCDDSGLRPNSGKFREARAREQRYQWFSSVCGIEDLLITAHHLEDQGETLLLRLMRGSAVRGLGAMRPAQRLYGMMVLRPLLEVPKQRLQEWVFEHNLEVVFDGSNLEEAYDRNFVRRRVFPILQTRWPNTANALARSAGYFQEVQSILDGVAAEDLAECTLSGGKNVLWDLGSICKLKLLQLDRPRALNVLRYWVDTNGLHVPSERALREFVRQLDSDSQSASPVLSAGGASFRCYRDRIFLVPEHLLNEQAPSEVQG